jgi:hypothetical protein
MKFLWNPAAERYLMGPFSSNKVLMCCWLYWADWSLSESIKKAHKLSVIRTEIYPNCNAQKSNINAVIKISSNAMLAVLVLQLIKNIWF